MRVSRTWLGSVFGALAIGACSTPAREGATPSSAGVATAGQGVAPASAGGGWPWRGGRAVTVRIDPSQVIAPVTHRHFGNNTSWWAGKAWSLAPDRIAKARQAKLKFWRFPGGSASDDYVWHGNYGKYDKRPDGKSRSEMNADWALHTDEFIELCRTLEAEPIITVNYGMARWGTLEEAIELAKAWVKYFNHEKRLKVQYWEIGNEQNGDWESGHTVEGKPKLTGAMYGKDVRAFSAAMKAVDPSIKIGAVAVPHDNGDAWTGYEWWMRGMLPELQGSVDFLILHDYFIWPFEGKTLKLPSDEAVFGSSRKVGEHARAVDEMRKKYTQRSEPFELVLTEFNIVNGNVPHTIELINGLFTAEIVGEAIAHRYAAVNYWDWSNGYDDKFGGGDHAMLARGDPAVPDATPRPSYYAYAVFARAFGDELVQARSSDERLKIYASRFVSGDIGFVAVNELAEPAELRLSIAGLDGQRTLRGWALTGQGLHARQVSWNGVAGPAGGGGPFPIDDIAPYTAVVANGAAFTLGLPASSLVGVVVD